jgi:hypothetical protein
VDIKARITEQRRVKDAIDVRVPGDLCGNFPAIVDVSGATAAKTMCASRRTRSIHDNYSFNRISLFSGLHCFSRKIFLIVKRPILIM